MFREIISKPLGLERLRSLLPEDSKAVLYESLRGKKRSEVFKNITTLVVLYETKIDNKKEGHFVVLIPRAHSLEYFSSLGRSPTDEMNALHQNPLYSGTSWAKIILTTGKSCNWIRIKSKIVDSGAWRVQFCTN